MSIAVLGAETYHFLPPGYNRYIATWGNDINDGTQSRPWRTLNKLSTYVVSLVGAAVLSAYIDAGTYIDDSFVPIANGLNGSAVINVTFAPGCVLQAGPSTSTGAGFEVSGSGGAWTCNLVGNNLRITGYNSGSGNGLGANNTAILNATDVRVDDCVDGASSHSSSQINLTRCTISNCSKSACTHVNTTVNSATDCYFTGRAGATLGVVGCQSTGQQTWTNCTFTPDSSGQSIDFGNGPVTLTKCKIGTPSARVSLSPGAITSVAITANDCYCNMSWDGRFLITLTRCFGKVSIRIRGATTATDLVMRKCAWVGDATGLSTGFLYGNFDDGSGNWDGIGYDIRDTICRNYGTVFGSGFSANQKTVFNGNSQGTFCDLFSDTTNYATGVTGTAQTGNITSDPQMGSFSGSTNQSDYAVSGGSPCVGAGFGGGNIGFTTSEI